MYSLLFVVVGLLVTTSLTLEDNQTNIDPPQTLKYDQLTANNSITDKPAPSVSYIPDPPVANEQVALKVDPIMFVLPNLYVGLGDGHQGHPAPYGPQPAPYGHEPAPYGPLSLRPDQYAAAPAHFPAPTLQQPSLYAPWGCGGYGKQGCVGSNCGYWNGCPQNQCGGFYDFRQCTKPTCDHGSYRGFGCQQGNCLYICHGQDCRSPHGYGHGCHDGQYGMHSHQGHHNCHRDQEHCDDHHCYHGQDHCDDDY